jgi:hypothetical protein
MIESSLSPDVTIPPNAPRKFPRWLYVVIPIGILGACCIAIIAAVLLLPSIFKVNMESGGYSIDEVILSSDLEDGQPVDIQNEFKPSDAIICTVKTIGVDGIITMKWYLGENLIYEFTGKTQNNRLSTYIESNSSSVIPEGEYHVDILILSDVLETVNFSVKIYHPNVSPPIVIPAGHRNIEVPWYPEVPFAFDEVWIIDDFEWKVNEVKVLLMEDTQEFFVAVVIDTDENVLSLSESEAKSITRPIALYAIETGYVETARSLQIDGTYYALDQYLFVILNNPSNHSVYRVQFTMDELMN